MKRHKERHWQKEKLKKNNELEIKLLDNRLQSDNKN